MLHRLCWLHLRDGPNRKSFSVENHSVRQVAKWFTGVIGVTSGRLDTSELDGEGCLGLPCQGLGGGVKSDGPVVDIGVVRIRPDGVGFAAEDAPVHIVEVGGDVALAHVEVDPIWEILGKIMDSP